jgi:hypothetical protein
MNSEILKLTNKHPVLRKYAEKQIENYPESIVFSFIETYLKYKNILRGKIEFKENVENLNDLISSILKRENVLRFIKDNIKKDMIGNLDNVTYEMIEDVYYNFDDKKWLAKDMFSRVSSCNTQDDLKLYINQYYNNSMKFSLEIIKDKIDDKESSIYVEDGDTLIVEIKSYEGIKELGSNKWCISNYYDYYDYYTEELKRQFIIYDFKKLPYESLSMIGITVSIDGKIISAFDKNNNDIIESQNIHDHYFPKISKKDIIEMIKYKGVVNVISEAALLDMNDVGIDMVNDLEITISDVVGIVRKISMYGDTKTLSKIIIKYIDFFSNVEYLKLFSCYCATKAFTIICNNIDLTNENVEKGLWESAYNLTSNQEDNEFEIVIKKIAQIKNKDINYISDFIKSISIHSDFCNYLDILIVNMKDLNWKLIKFDINELMFFIVPLKHWEIILKGDLEINIDSMDLFFSNIKKTISFQSESVNYNKNKEQISKILNRKLA